MLNRVNTLRSAVRGHFRVSIGFTLSIAFVVVALSPVAIVALAGLHQLDQQAHSQLTSQLAAIADIKSNQIQDWLDDDKATLDVFFANPAQFKDIRDTLIGDQQTQLGASFALTQTFNAELKPLDAFDEFFLYNPDGQILVSTTARQVGKIVVAEPYYQPSLSSDYIQPPFYEVGAEELSMVVSRPVYNTDGKIIGVLAGRLNLNQLSDTMLQDSGLGQTGETYLVSLESNYLVTASRFDGYPLRQAYHSLGIDNALKGSSGTGIYAGFRGTSVIGVYRWLPKLQVGLLAEMDESEALATVNQVRNLSTTIAIIGGTLGIVLALGTALWVTRPIVALTHTATAIAAGDYSQRAAVTRGNEIGQLAMTFNRMTERLIQTIAELNQRIEEIRQAKESARAKDVFLATMSHELRTPLNAIIGFLGILGLAGKLDDDSLHMVQRARANAERLLRLINDILEISRIEAGRLELVQDDVHVRDLIGSLGSQMEVLAEQKGVRFAVQVDDAVPSIIRADQDALTKIVTNLLGNAFKFTDKGSVSLRVSRAGASLQIEVKDTGIGIPLHMQDVIFENFRQVNDTIARSHGGSGLGLSIVRQLCLAMGGSVRVNSAPSQGSTFTILIPIQKSVELEKVS